jgi:alpha-beta hydrolase superfamily lysophospholipase
MKSEVEFRSEGATLRGLLFMPEAGPRRPPVVIMAHGTSATVPMAADRYAEAFCRAGLAVLLYDHRNFGRSDGEPRQEINPWTQCRGYRDAIDFVAGRIDVDPARIGLWGDSYTGGQVIVVGAIDDRVRAIVAQCPVFGEKPPAVDASARNFAVIRETLVAGDVRGAAATTTGPLPVVSADQAATPSLLKPIAAFRWFTEHGNRPGTGWVNRVTRVIPDTPIVYDPGLCAPFVHAPTLMVVAPEDEMAHANSAVARLAFERIAAPKQWHDIAGGHFGLLYWPGALFDEASGVETAFFAQWLDAPRRAVSAAAASPS